MGMFLLGAVSPGRPQSLLCVIPSTCGIKSLVFSTKCKEKNVSGSRDDVRWVTQVGVRSRTTGENETKCDVGEGIVSFFERMFACQASSVPFHGRSEIILGVRLNHDVPSHATSVPQTLLSKRSSPRLDGGQTRGPQKLPKGARRGRRRGCVAGLARPRWGPPTRRRAARGFRPPEEAGTGVPHGMSEITIPSLGRWFLSATPAISSIRRLAA